MFVIIYIHFDIFSLNLVDSLIRKYINRIEDRILPKDDSSYIAEIDKKLEEKDVMDVENRYVTFGNQLKQKVQDQKSHYLATKEGIRWALDAAGNTGQYIKYVNMKIDKHQAQINHIKQLHEKFDKEIAQLQSQKLEKIDLSKTSIETLDSKSITRVLDQLLLVKRNTKFKLKKLENECSIAEKELEQQEIQIQEIREHLKETQSQGTNSFDIVNELTALKVIKEELHHLSRENDVKKLSNAIDIVVSSLNSKY
jgi:hypothetical protein